MTDDAGDGVPCRGRSRSRTGRARQDENFVAGRPIPRASRSPRGTDRPRASTRSTSRPAVRMAIRDITVDDPAGLLTVPAVPERGRANLHLWFGPDAQHVVPSDGTPVAVSVRIRAGPCRACDLSVTLLSFNSSRLSRPGWPAGAGLRFCTHAHHRPLSAPRETGTGRDGCRIAPTTRCWSGRWRSR